MSLSKVSTRLIVKSELIEIVIPANLNGNPKTKIQFPDNQNLRNTHLMGIETYNEPMIPISPLSQGQVVIGPDLMRYIFVTLQGYNGKNFVWQMPLQEFVNLAAITVWNEFPVVFAGQKVNWPKSYIEISDSAQISTVNAQSVLFNIYYKEFEKVEAKDKKASFKKQS